MIELTLGAESLGRTVFGFSPLSEAASSLRVLTHCLNSPLHQPWLRDVRGRLGSVDLQLLTPLVGHPLSPPDFLYPTVSSLKVTIEDQLGPIEQMTGEEIGSQLSIDGRASHPPAIQELIARGPDAGKVAAESILTYWRVAVAPYWRRISTVLEEDVGHRATRGLTDGLLGVVDGLHPNVSVAADRLCFEMTAHADHSYGDAALTLVPCVFIAPGLIVTHDVPGRFQALYGARGAARVWEGLSTPNRRSRPLEELLGRNRAHLLMLLRTPQSTTDLARQVRMSPAAVSKHLRILRESGLATSWRAGRVVFYQETPLANSLVELNDPSLRNRL